MAHRDHELQFVRLRIWEMHIDIAPLLTGRELSSSGTGPQRRPRAIVQIANAFSSASRASR